MYKTVIAFLCGFVISIIVSVFCLCNVNSHNKLNKNMLDLYGTDWDKQEEAFEYLLDHPVEALPYLIAGLHSNKEKYVSASSEPPVKTGIKYRPIYQDKYVNLGTKEPDKINTQDSNEIKEDFPKGTTNKVSDLIFVILYHRDLEGVGELYGSFESKGWENWYSENYPYLYQDRWWLETNMLAKRCKINILDWNKLGNKHKEYLAEKIYQQENEKCLKVGINVKQPEGEIKHLIDNLTAFTEKFRASDESREKADILMSDIAKKGDTVIPMLMYSFDRNLSFLFREAVIGILRDINTDLSGKALLRVFYDNDERDIFRRNAFYHYIKSGRDNWQQLVVTQLITRFKTDYIWQPLYNIATLEFEPSKQGIEKFIPMLIKELNTAEAEIRKNIGILLSRILKRIVIVKENNFTDIVSVGAVDEQLITDNLVNISPEQVQLVVNKWQEWWEQNKDKYPVKDK